MATLIQKFATVSYLMQLKQLFRFHLASEKDSPGTIDSNPYADSIYDFFADQLADLKLPVRLTEFNGYPERDLEKMIGSLFEPSILSWTETGIKITGPILKCLLLDMPSSWGITGHFSGVGVYSEEGDMQPWCFGALYGGTYGERDPFKLTYPTILNYHHPKGSWQANLLELICFTAAKSICIAQTRHAAGADSWTVLTVHMDFLPLKPIEASISFTKGHDSF